MRPIQAVRLFVFALVVFLFASSAWAQDRTCSCSCVCSPPAEVTCPPAPVCPPPVVCEPAPAPSPVPNPIPTPGSLRDLGTRPAGMPAVAWPFPPTTSSSAAVSSSTALVASLQVAGRHTTVSGSHPGSFTINVDDVRITMAPGASIGTLIIGRRVNRVWVTGGTFGRIEVLPPQDYSSGATAPDPALIATDVLLESVIVTNTSSYPAVAFRGDRHALIGSYVSSAAQFALWVGDTRPVQNHDIIAAYNTFDGGGQATHRMHDVVNSIATGNHYIGDVRHNYRIHGDSAYNAAYNNILTVTGIMIGTEPGDTVSHQWFVGNRIYYQATNGVFILPPHPNCSAATCLTDFVMAGNTWFSTPIVSMPSPLASWSISGNTMLGYQAPPAPISRP